MTDRLKNFIQKHKNFLDQKKPDVSQFDTIWELTQKNIRTSSPGSHSKNHVRFYVGIAASLLLMVSSYWYFNKPSTVNLNQVLSSRIEATNTAQMPTVNAASENVLPSNTESSPELHHKTSVSQNSLSHQSKNIQKRHSHKTITVDQNPEMHYNHTAENIVQAKDNANDIVQNTTQENNNLSTIQSNENQPAETIQQQSITSVTNKSHSNSKSEYSSVGKVLRKGLFGLISKKTHQWSENKIVIHPEDKDDKTIIAFNVNTHSLKMNKEVTLP